MLSRIMDLNVLTHGYANPQTPQTRTDSLFSHILKGVLTELRGH